MSLGYELAELINDASRLAGGTISNDRIVLTASEIPDITTAKITDIGDYATVTYVDQQVSNLVNSAPATLDTLNELAAALGDDPNYATSVATELGTKATTAYVDGEVTTLNTAIANKVDASYVSSALAPYATITYVNDEIAGVTAGQSNLSKGKTFVSTANQTSFGPIDHTSGNVDVWLNGVLLLNQIVDADDTTGTDNLASGTYDYQSQIATYTGSPPTITGSPTTHTIAGEASNTILFATAPSTGSKIVIRGY